jgi:hypothetical protein
VVVEVSRKAYLASIVPVIVDSILNEHQIIVDIVAFVSRGDFPRSRLGEKQRGKILAGWVSRKMRTIAQFAIRDSSTGLGNGDGDANQEAHRASYGSHRSSSGAQIGLASVGSTLRNVEPAPQILEQRELESQLERISAIPSEAHANYGTAPGENGHGHGRDQMTPTGPSAPAGHGFDLPDFGQFENDGRPEFGPQSGTHQQTPEIRLPDFQGVDWRGHVHPSHGPAGHARNPSIQNEEDWTADAIASMNLADRDNGGRGY